MIEIRISNTVAVQLLVDKMEAEFRSRIKAGIYSDDMTIDKLPFNQILEITEIAVFDAVSILPYDIILKDTNIHEIIAKAIQSLAVIFNHSAFSFYTPEKVQNILLPMKKLYNEAEDKKSFVYN
jgi:hypothetical protein